MKQRTFLAIVLFLLFCLAVIPGRTQEGVAVEILSAQVPSEPQTKKPGYDYMSSILSRDTKPLGLQEDPVLKKLMDQPAVKWALRSCKKHILN